VPADSCWRGASSRAPVTLFLQWNCCSSVPDKFWGVFSVIFLVLETQAAKWFEDKYSHRPASITTDQLRQIAYPPTRTNFEQLLDPILIPRVSGTENNRKVAEYIKNHMKNLDWTVTTDAFEDNTPHGRKYFENIIATLNPDTHRRLVLACHYDSKYFRENNFVGATDSAVPCAMLLDLATSMKNYLDAHKNAADRNVTLQLVFFDGEEAFQDWSDVDSIYGSRHLAKVWESTPYPPGNKENTNELDRIDVMMLLDLLGTANPSFPNFFPSTQHWHNDLVAIESTMRNGRMWTGNHRGRTYFKAEPSYSGVEDDHIPFLKRNVNILHMISVPFPRVWHKPSDDKSALDFQTIDNLNRIMRVFVARYLHLPGSGV